MAEPQPIHKQHPRLYAKCMELVGNDEAARVLAFLVVKTAPNEGRGGIVLEGERITLPRNIRRMKLHLLMGEGMHA